MSPQTVKIRWQTWLPELYVLIACWVVAAGIAWRLSWPEAKVLGEFGLMFAGFAYFTILSIFWILGDKRGPIQSFSAWLIFFLIALVSASLVFVVAANRGMPASLADFAAVKDNVANAWTGRDQWIKTVFQGTLWLAIPVAAWLAYGIFGNSFQTFSRQQFVEQMTARRARIILMVLTVIVLAYNYLRYRKYFEYPYATSVEVDTHANVLRLALAIAIGQWLFVKTLEMIRHPILKFVLPLVMTWCPILIEWKFRIVHQFLPIPGFGLGAYVMTFNILVGTAIFATGFMLMLALARRLPRIEPKASQSVSLETTPGLSVSQVSPVMALVGLLWVGGVALVYWVPQYLEVGTLFEDVGNPWSVARGEAKLREYASEVRTNRVSKTGYTSADQPMSLGSDSAWQRKLIRIGPESALDPNFHAALAKLKPGSFLVNVDVSEANYSLMEIVTLKGYRFRDFPPITFEEFQRNAALVSGLYLDGNRVRDSHLNAEALDQLRINNDFHELTRCTFSPDFLAALNPQTAAHFRFVDCAQAELLDADLAYVEYVYDSLETAPMTLEDWRRITSNPKASVMIRNLPDPLPSYLKVGPRYYFNEVVFVEPVEPSAGE